MAHDSLLRPRSYGRFGKSNTMVVYSSSRPRECTLVETNSTYIVGAELPQDFVWDQGVPGHRSAAKFLL